jgi:hypothetical protein
MDITKRFLFGTILLSLSTMFIVSAGAVDEEIKQLNDDLVLNKMGEAEKVIGMIPDNAHPESFLVNGWYWPFDKQAPKILGLIDVLVQNKQEVSCRECLDRINSIFYLQCHKFVNDLSDDKFEAQDMASGTKDQLQAKSMGSKDQLLEILFRTYYCQSTTKSSIVYSYETLPLALIMTKAVINMFLAKMHSSWTYKQKQSLVSRTFFEAKSDLWCELNSCGKSLPVWRSVNIEETELCVGLLHKFFIQEVSPYPWGRWFWTGAKYTTIAAAVIAAGLLAKYGYNKLCGEADRGLNRLTEVADGRLARLKEVTDNVGVNAVAHVGETAGVGFVRALGEFAKDKEGQALIKEINGGGIGLVEALARLVEKLGPAIADPFMKVLGTLERNNILKKEDAPKDAPKEKEKEEVVVVVENKKD